MATAEWVLLGERRNGWSDGGVLKLDQVLAAWAWMKAFGARKLSGGRAIKWVSQVQSGQVRVPLENMLGGRGDAFVVDHVRLGGGLHHAMRTVAQAKRALDMMCQRVLSRVTKGEPVAMKQMVQDKDCGLVGSIAAVSAPRARDRVDDG